MEKININNAAWLYNTVEEGNTTFHYSKVLTLHDIAFIGSQKGMDYFIPTLINVLIWQEQRNGDSFSYKMDIATNGVFIESIFGETLSYTRTSKYSGRGRYYAPPDHPLGEVVIKWGYDE